ncbi:MAG: hypothetical protein FJ128_06800 [Deltaproteobacteria bacterium]|nr:hypothetical protein [Deltaproteobacteria bacterium]
MAESKTAEGKYLACCEVCGRWREVPCTPQWADRFFFYWQAEFTCCGRRQAALFAAEKEDDDIH